MAKKDLKDVTPHSLKYLASKGFSKKGAAAFLGIAAETLSRKFAEYPDLLAAWDAGVAEKELTLRELQFRHAKRRDGSGVTMTIHMSKHQLGEHDRALVNHNHTGQVDLVHQLLQAIDGTTRGLPNAPKTVAAEPRQPSSLLPDRASVPERP